MSEKLKPCPFCEGESDNYDAVGDDGRAYYWIQCMNGFCRAKGPTNRIHDLAIKAWNTRASGWISVEDRLPEDEQWVLAYTNEKSDGYLVVTLRGNFWVENGTGCGCCCYSPSITHWQPLPAPPEHFVDANKKVGGDD